MDEGECGDVIVLPLYASLPPEQQARPRWCLGTGWHAGCCHHRTMRTASCGLQDGRTVRFVLPCRLCSPLSGRLAGEMPQCRRSSLYCLPRAACASDSACSCWQLLRRLSAQALVFVPPPEGCRRIVVATNVAETSITIDGVVYVIDPGLVKQKSYSPQTGLDTLAVVPISRCWPLSPQPQDPNPPASCHRSGNIAAGLPC